MFILFGTKFIHNTVPFTATDTQKAHCSQCKKENLFFRVSSQKYFHVFFLPLFPVGEEIEGIKCEVCKNIRGVPRGWNPDSEKAERERIQKFFEESTGKNGKEKEELLYKWFDDTMGNLFYRGSFKLDGKTYKFIQKKQRHLFGMNVKRELCVFNDATNEWETGDQSIAERVIKEGVPLKESSEKS